MLRALLGGIKQARDRSVVIYIVAVALFGLVCLFHVSSAPTGLSPAEATARTDSQSLHAIARNPINAPHKLGMLAAHNLNFDGRGSLRADSIAFAVIFGLSFYLLAYGWFGRSVGLMGTLIFISTPIFIITARQASAEIMLFSPVLVFAVYSWLLRTKKHTKEAWFCLVTAAGLCIYVPGLVWWLIAAVYVNRIKLRTFIVKLSNQLIGLSAALLALLIAPLCVATVQNWNLVHGWLVVPVHWPHVFSLLKNLIWMTVALFARMPFHTDLVIGRLPILDIVQVALLVFGIYAMWTAAKNKAVTLGASIGFAIVAAAINNSPTLLILGLPAIAIFVTAGLRYLYIEWRSVFPNNPISKSLALALMICVVIAHLAFGLSYSLVAWPHTLATRTTYVIK
jgi:hypothetical protein